MASQIDYDKLRRGGAEWSKSVRKGYDAAKNYVTNRVVPFWSDVGYVAKNVASDAKHRIEEHEAESRRKSFQPKIAKGVAAWANERRKKMSRKPRSSGGRLASPVPTKVDITPGFDTDEMLRDIPSLAAPVRMSESQKQREERAMRGARGQRNLREDSDFLTGQLDKRTTSRRPAEDFGRQQATDMRKASNVGKIVINGRAFDSVSEARKLAKQTARENRTRRAALVTAQELGLDTKSKGSAFAGFDVSAGGAITDAQKAAIAKGLQSQVDEFRKRLQGSKGGNYATYQAEQQRKIKEAHGKDDVPGTGADASSAGTGRGNVPHMTTLERDARRKEEQTAQRDQEYRNRQKAEQDRLNYANSGRGSYDRSVASMNDLFQQAQADENRKVIRGMKSVLRRAKQFGIELDLQGE